MFKIIFLFGNGPIPNDFPCMAVPCCTSEKSLKNSPCSAQCAEEHIGWEGNPELGGLLEACRSFMTHLSSITGVYMFADVGMRRLFSDSDIMSHHVT